MCVASSVQGNVREKLNSVKWCESGKTQQFCVCSKHFSFWNSPHLRLLLEEVLFFPLCPQIESSSSPTHRWKTVPSSSVTTPSVGCAVTPELR